MTCVKCGDFVSHSDITGLRCSACFVGAHKDNCVFWAVFFFALGLVMGEAARHILQIRKGASYENVSRVH